MAIVFKINEELASIAVTATELHSVSKTAVQYINSKDFIAQFSAIVLEINRAYSILDGLFKPFCILNTEELFSTEFDKAISNFKNSYLLEISKPRKYYDNIYEAYVGLQQTKEAKTNFPMIKNNFIRLNDLYDKWINNDAYLAMSIDRAIKLENNLLTDIATLKTKDMEDAYFVFRSSFDDFNDYLSLIQNSADNIRKLFSDNYSG